MAVFFCVFASGCRLRTGHTTTTPATGADGGKRGYNFHATAITSDDCVSVSVRISYSDDDNRFSISFVATWKRFCCPV